ncbi:vacuolar transporter chaperone [Podila minutissima]|uniref:Vacuolar transporter chaperone n=1 Tax=Podila minutissima TaxID=64525 RepID=A0A9P5VN62_9FUNG|nr:vacuolar transporter chaperone [Podila minutissima]
MARFQSSSPSSPTSPTYQHHQYQHQQQHQHQHQQYQQNRYPDHSQDPLPPPPALSNHNVVIPRRGSSSNIYQSAPLQSPVGSSHSSNSYSNNNNNSHGYSSTSNPFASPSSPGFNHPLDGRPQQSRLDFDLEKDLDLGLSPPHPTFAGQNRGRTPSPSPSSSSTLHANPQHRSPPSNSNNNNYSHNNNNNNNNNSYPQPSFSRPESVHSFSNLSTHSNEPLNPPRVLNKKMSAGTMSSSNSTRVGGSPLHNKYNMNKANSKSAKFRNHLDLPEDKSRAYRPQGHGRNPAHGPAPGMMDDIDLDEDEDEKPRKSAMKPGTETAVVPGDLTPPKPRKTLISRLKRVSSIKQHMARNIKMGGTGKKAQFSCERLYLQWIRFGILQSSIAVTLLSFGDEVASYVGVGALVLSLLTLTYATTLYHKRYLWMVTKRQDVAYFAKTVPTLITVALFVLYLANFINKPNARPPWVQNDVKFGI